MKEIVCEQNEDSEYIFTRDDTTLRIRPCDFGAEKKEAFPHEWFMIQMDIRFGLLTFTQSFTRYGKPIFVKSVFFSDFLYFCSLKIWWPLVRKKGNISTWVISDLNSWHSPCHLEVWQVYLCWVFILFSNFFVFYIKCKKLLFRLLITNPTWCEGQSRVAVQPFECIRITVNHVYWQEVGRSWLDHSRWQRLPRAGGTILWKALILPKFQTYSADNPTSFFQIYKFEYRFCISLQEAVTMGMSLSSSVATAIDFLWEEAGLPQFHESEATSTFVRNIDVTFDALNSKKTLAKGSKAPVTKRIIACIYQSV